MSTRGTDAAFANPETPDSHGSYGLTKRELFAAMAMQALLGSRFTWPDGRPVNTGEVRARWAVQAADALIAALNESEDGGES